MPKKPIRFVLEFSGHQTARVDGDGTFLRPPTATEIAAAFRDELNRRFEDGGTKFKITVKPID